MFFLEGHLAGQRDSSTLDTPFLTRCEHDSSGRARNEVRLYNAYASAIPSGQPCFVQFSGDPSVNPYVVSGLASGTVVRNILVVPQVAVAASSWGWFAFAGYASCLVDGTTDVTTSDFLKSSNGTAGGLIKDGTTEATTSCAIATAAQTANSAVAITVYLMNEKVSIAA